jgi:hypothetical protein
MLIFAATVQARSSKAKKTGPAAGKLKSCIEQEFHKSELEGLIRMVNVFVFLCNVNMVL